MIVPDLDLLIFAHNERNPWHQKAKTWWEELADGTEPIVIPWQVSKGFIRQMANPNIIASAWEPSKAAREVAQWLSLEHITDIEPGPSYLNILEQILAATGATRKLVPDAAIAALAIEKGAEVHTNNVRDFRRFEGLFWWNPLTEEAGP